MNEVRKMIVKKNGLKDESEGHYYKHKGSIIAGSILIFLGVFFMLKNFFGWLSFDYVWPIVLIIVGAIILFKRDN
jgi:hypothetical protein